MSFNCPLSKSKAAELIGLLDLPPDSRVIDVGCGSGEFLIGVVEQYAVRGVGVDITTTTLEEARSLAATRVPDSQMEFLEVDIRTLDAAPDSYDCGICMGSTHAYSLGEAAYPEALRGLSRIVRPGGKLLIGEGYWMQPPPREYLDFIGEPVGVYRTHLENVELAKEFGLIPQYAVTSNLDEWDDFEWRHNIRKEKTAAANPDDPETTKMLTRSREWRAAYLRWGRGTMGFAFYLFERP